MARRRLEAHLQAGKYIEKGNVMLINCCLIGIGDTFLAHLTQSVM
jgi:hypothetical protein